MTKMNEGERAVVVARDGCTIGKSGFMHRFCYSIAIIKPNRHYNYYGHHTPYFLESTRTYAKHYLSGLNKIDSKNCREGKEELEKIAEMYNQTREF